MTLDSLYTHLIKQSEQLDCEYTRLFHGRGNTYGGYRFLTVDSVDEVLFAVFFESSDAEESIITLLQKLYLQNGRWKALVIQQRYLSSAPSHVIEGELPVETYAIENGLKYRVNFIHAQNIGFFPDMKEGRNFIRSHAHGKKVLNLFSYTCSFSVVAIEAGAYSVVNVDMNKNVLSIGRDNHRLNGIETKNVTFMPHNILKSWNAIKKGGPYELIIIDPPSFQKGSFAATADYVKIIRRLHEFSADRCTVLSALNAPELDSEFIKTLFRDNASEFEYVERLKNLENFPEIEEERSLKNLIFIKKPS